MADENDAPSVGDSLAAALEKVEVGEGVAHSTPDDAAPDAPVAAPATEPAAKTREGRDASGKFTKRTATADTPPAIANAAPEAQAHTAATAPAEPDAPPAGWKDGAKAKWASLDPEIQAEVRRREREVNVGLQNAAETRKFGDAIANEIAPYVELLREEGAGPVDAVRILLETVYTLRHGSPEHKKALMLHMINQYGIDFSNGINQDRAELERERDMRASEARRQQEYNKQQITYAAVSELESFRAQPGHEHLDILRADMAAMLRGGLATDFQSAYEKAAWANPQVRQAMQQAENMRRQQEFSRNRNAVASVTGSPGAVNANGSVDPKNLRATIEAQFDGGRF